MRQLTQEAQQILGCLRTAASLGRGRVRPEAKRRQFTQESQKKVRSLERAASLGGGRVRPEAKMNQFAHEPQNEVRSLRRAASVARGLAQPGAQLSQFAGRSSKECAISSQGCQPPKSPKRPGPAGGEHEVGGQRSQLFVWFLCERARVRLWEDRPPLRGWRPSEEIAVYFVIPV